ncbi:MAG: hypothetical protein MUE50_22065 [Pirellulaceae bacterium]|nr:hypothetical protein [Pirellulaceae bacterium]
MTPSLRAALLALVALLSTGRFGHSEQPDIIRPLPPVDATEPQLPWAAGPRALLASDPQEYRMPEDVLPPHTPPLAAHKNGFFQKLSFTATEIFPDGGDGLGILETELFAAFALPAPTTDSPLVIVPTLDVQFPDSPSYTELPATLYATYLDLIWLPRISPSLEGILSVGAGCYSDFEGDDDGFRLTGRAIARYDWTPDRLQLVLGVLYINRYHTKLIPAAGVVWKPTEDLTLDLVFPQAKLARRMAFGAGFENWIYLSAGFGGNSWSIVDAAGDPDVLILKDWRIMLGWEQVRDGGAGYRVEVGYVFSREIEFALTQTYFYPDDTMLARGVVTF